MLGPKSQIVPAPGFVAHPKRRGDKPCDPHLTTKPHPSYSVDKFRDLRSYGVAVTTWRMLWVYVSLPLPALAAAIVPVFLPLQHPRSGTTMSYYAHASPINFTTSLACLSHWTAATRTSLELFTLCQIVIVSGLSSLLLVVQFVILTKYWVFPIPFTSATCSSLWCFDILIALAIVLGRRLWEFPSFRQSFKLYGPCMVLQTAQIAIYPGINVLYDRCNDVQRVIITLIFPVVKYGLKRLLLYFGGELGEFQTEVAVSGVEICVSLY